MTTGSSYSIRTRPVLRLCLASCCLTITASTAATGSPSALLGAQLRSQTDRTSSCAGRTRPADSPLVLVGTTWSSSSTPAAARSTRRRGAARTARSAASAAALAAHGLSSTSAPRALQTPAWRTHPHQHRRRRHWRAPRSVSATCGMLRRSSCLPRGRAPRPSSTCPELQWRRGRTSRRAAGGPPCRRS